MRWGVGVRGVTPWRLKDLSQDVRLGQPDVGTEPKGRHRSLTRRRHPFREGERPDLMGYAPLPPAPLKAGRLVSS